MSKRAGLGRGLGALIPGANEAKIIDIPVRLIRPNPHQPRKEFAPEDLEELSASIAEIGLLQPVVVRPVDDGSYELLVGERRMRAATMAGIGRIPAIVREADDKEALEQALVENLQRSDLRPLEEAHAYRSLVEMFELTQEEVARRVGKSRVHVTNTLRLLDLPEGVRALLDSGVLTAGHARAILTLRDPSRQEAAARRVVEEGLTVRQLEAMAREEQTGGSQPAKRRSRREGAYPDLEEALADALGTVVKVEGGRGKGKIVIRFGSRQDLERISAVLLDGSEDRRWNGSTSERRDRL